MLLGRLKLYNETSCIDVQYDVMDDIFVMQSTVLCKMYRRSFLNLDTRYIYPIFDHIINTKMLKDGVDDVI